MNPPTGQHYSKVLITGASSGIGLALAHQFLGRGFECFLTGLDHEELAGAVVSLRIEFPEASMLQMAIDLSTVGAAIQLYQHCANLDWFPDVLINNAGFGTYGYITEISMEQELAMIQLHVVELYTLTRLFMVPMLTKGHGQVINISSISAFQPNALLATYGATKAFVYQFTRALQYELKLQQSRVRAMAVCPTPVRTNFGKNTDLKKTKLFQSWMTVDVEHVATSIMKAMDAGADHVVPGRLFHWLSKFSKRLPERLQMWMAYQHLKPNA